MIWVIVGTIGLGLFILGLIHFLKKTRKGERLDGAGMAEGIGIGMMLAAVICVPLAEFGGYPEVWEYAPLGLIAGLGLGAYFERRKRGKRLQNQ